MLGALSLLPLIASPSVAWLVAQPVTDTGPDTTATLITAIAGSSPFAALAIYVIISYKSDAKEAREQRDELVKDMMERVIPGQVESNRLHAETIKTFESVMITAHTLASRAYDPGTQAEILRHLSRLRGPRT